MSIKKSRFYKFAYELLYGLVRKHKRKILFILSKIFPCHESYKLISLRPTDLDIKVIDKKYQNEIDLDFTVITPVLNEAKTIEKMLSSLEKQSLRPREVIIVDCGSTDGTLSRIKEYKGNGALKVTVIHSPVKNIGYQRNLAIDKAVTEILVNIDSGTVLSKDYLINLLGPFVGHSEVDLTCGVHYPETTHPWSSRFSPRQHFSDKLDPYGACVAYKKTLALQVGKYPEYLSYAGEDTLFFYKYGKKSKKWVFNKAAILYWEHPKTYEQAHQKVLSYTKANFEIGLAPFLYIEYFSALKFMQKIGYRQNIILQNYYDFQKSQVQIELNKRKISGLTFIVSKKSLFSTDDELRQLAFDAIKNNHKAIFINIEVESRRKNKVFYNTDHTLLDLVYYKNLDIRALKKLYGNFFTDRSTFVITLYSPFVLDLVKEVRRVSKKIKIIFYPINDQQFRNFARDQYFLENVDRILLKNKDTLKGLKNTNLLDKVSFVKQDGQLNILDLNIII